MGRFLLGFVLGLGIGYSIGIVFAPPIVEDVGPGGKPIAKKVTTPNQR